MTAINLGIPVTRDESQSNKPACLSHDPELWFPGDGSVGRFRAEQAKDICRTECPARVRVACLKEALDDDTSDGIWGGLDEKERKKLRG